MEPSNQSEADAKQEGKRGEEKIVSQGNWKFQYIINQRCILQYIISLTKALTT